MYPIVSEGSLYFTTGYQELIALAAENGALLWRYKPDFDRKGKTEQVHDRVFSLYFSSYSMRTDRYRFTRYFKPVPVLNSTLGDTLGSYELYDHANDPDENTNLAYDKAHQALREKLEQEMDEYGFLREKE